MDFIRGVSKGMETRRKSSLFWRALICGFVVISSSSSSSASTDPLSRCPPGVSRTHYLKATEWDTCYEFHMEERTWRNANHVCSRNGGHLVTIREKRIQNFLLKSLVEYRWPRNGLWIGATDKDKEMEWRWITGELVNSGYSNWASGQPSCGVFCFEDCAIMRWKESGGQWHDYRCNWIEDYSFVCEYKMMPTTTTSTTELTTTTTTEATATTTTEAATTTTDPTVIVTAIKISSSKDLDSEYLLLGHSRERDEDKEEKKENKTEKAAAGQSSNVMLHNVAGAKEEQIQENVSSSGISSGTLAVVIAVMSSLLVGLCILFVFFRRRHRKHIREDDMGISYENPYYEESKTPLSNKRDDNDDASIADETGGACGGQSHPDLATLKKGKEINNPPPSPPRAQLRRVMNNYDTPPTLTTRLLTSSDKGDLIQPPRFRHEKNSPSRLDDQSHVTQEEENYYDEVNSQRPASKYTYEVPRATELQQYANDDADLPDSLLEQPYSNISTENIYESVDNLEAMMEQLRQIQAEEPTYSNEKPEEERYVPFALDAVKEPKELKSE